MFLIITECPLVYKKFFPLGSPPNTNGCPRCVLGRQEYIFSERNKTKNVNIVLSTLKYNSNSTYCNYKTFFRKRNKILVIRVLEK